MAALSAKQLFHQKKKLSPRLILLSGFSFTLTIVYISVMPSNARTLALLQFPTTMCTPLLQKFDSENKGQFTSI